MPINIRCPHCNQGYSVSEDMVGRSIVCKKCNNMIMVPDVKPSEQPGFSDKGYGTAPSNQPQGVPPQQQMPPPQQYQNPQFQQGQNPPPPYQQGQYPPPPHQQGQYPPQQYGYQQYAPMQHQVNIPNNLVWAILSLILCFWPTGIAAVVCAAKVDSRIAMGDYAGAKEAARKSKKWSWISFIVGILFTLLYLSFVGFIGAAGF
ncbi:MAG: CD225/dispanin family protein [Planctomycetes bacterium]|nr:CD225/dispanin family protein [Planctomycetota bacterium]